VTSLETSARACLDHLRAVADRVAPDFAGSVVVVSLAPDLRHGWEFRYRAVDGPEEITIVIEPGALQSVAQSPWFGYWHLDVVAEPTQRRLDLVRIAARLCRALAGADLNEPPCDVRLLLAPAPIDKTGADCRRIDLPSECGRGCVFCAVPQNPTTGPIRGFIERRAALAALASLRPGDKLLLSGQDCLQSPLLDQALSVAARLGLTEVGVQTPGTRLRDGRFVDSLVRRGVTFADLTAHGETPETFDAVGGFVGAYDCFWSGVDHLVTRGVPVYIEVPIVRQNADEIPALLARLCRLPVRIGCFAWYPDPEFAAPFESIALRYAEIVALLADAAKVVPKRRLSVSGIPACAAPSELREHFGWTYPSNHSPIEDRVRIGRCADCEWRQSCPGVAAKYLAAYGDPAPIDVAPTPV
jgi:MoaA/NifB/PqqE/SkfB family radical SAM enzyme